ncbi:cation diffusion facilitator family transporter [Geoglobus sp.]
MLTVLALYLLAFALKLAGYLLTGYLILLADAMHSITDIATIILLMYSARISEKPPDQSHPLGHDLARNVASLVASISFITIVSFELFKEGVASILSQRSEFGDPALAIVIEAFVLAVLVIATLVSMRRSGVISRTMFVESLNDSLSTVAAIAGIVMISYGYAFFDGLVAVAIAMLIFYNSVRLFRQNAKFLLGFSPSDEFYHRVERVALAFEDIKGVHDMVAIYIGEDKIHLDMHITVDGNMRIDDADRLSERLSNTLKEKIPEIKHVNIHICPHFGTKRVYCCSD